MTDTSTELKQTASSVKTVGWICLILGALCMAMPVLVGTYAILMVGMLLFAAGVLRILMALRMESSGHRTFTFVFGGLALLGGGALLANPMLGSAIFTILLATYLAMDGACELIAWFQNRKLGGQGILLIGGIISLLLAVSLWQQFPLSGVWAIGILFGIKLILMGLIMILTGNMVRGVASRVVSA